MAVFQEFVRRTRWQSAYVSDLVPWRMVAAPGIILNKDRHALQRTYTVLGQDMTGDTLEAQGARMLQANNVLKRLGGRWMLQSEAQRMRVQDYLAIEETYPAAALIDADRRQAILESPGARETRYFMTLTWQPDLPTMQQIERLAVRNLPATQMGNDQNAVSLATFIEQTDYFMAMMGGILATWRPLTTTETLTYLHSCVSDRWHPVTVPGSVLDIDTQMCDTPLVSGWYQQLGSWHIRTCSILLYPAMSYVGITRALEAQDLDFRWCTRWLGLERHIQAGILRRTQEVWVHQERSIFARMAENWSGTPSRVIDSDATRKAEESNAARQELGADIVAYGDFTSTVTVWDTDRQMADEKIRTVMQAFEGQGFTMTQEKWHARDAWLSTHPGNRLSSVRRTKQHSLTLAHLCPGLSAAWPGPQRDDYLHGPAWFMAHTDTSSVYRVAQHVRDIGHTLFLGQTGSGKSTLIAFLVAQWFARPYGPRQCFWFDMDKSARLLTLLLGGHWYELGTPGIAFQPLRHIDDMTARSIALTWLLDRVEEASVPFSGEVQAYLASGLSKLAQEPVRARTLSALLTILATHTRDIDLKARAGRTGADGTSRPDMRLEHLVAMHHSVRMALLPFTKEGEYGWLFDADHDDLADGPLHTFEQRTLFTIKRLVKPVTSYVFQQIEQRFSTDVPTWLPLDEAAITAALPAYAEKYDEWLMTTRKKSVAMGFSINALHQITDEGTKLSELGRMLQANVPHRYLLPNPSANSPAMRMVYSHFGLTDQEIQMLATANPARDIYYSCEERGKRLFHLPLSPFILTCLARNTEADHALMDTILAKEGREGFAAAWLDAAGYTEEAQYLRKRSAACTSYDTHPVGALVR